MTFVRSRRAVPAALCLALLAAAGCTQPSPEEVDSESVVPVKTAPVTRGAIRGVVRATGVVMPAPGADLLVVAPEAARIAEIPPAVGDRVRRGDVLVQFEIPSAAADVERQRAEVAAARAALDTAKLAQTRSHDLFDRGVAARREVEDADRAVAEAEAALAQANASLAASQTLASRSVVRAAFDGIVAKRFHNPGDLVEASSGDPVLRVIDPARLEVIASVPLADAPRITIGAPASLSGTPLSASDSALHVLSRPAAVDPGTATVPVRLGFTGQTNLPAGAPVAVDIQAEQHDEALLVPAAAIVREGDETAVFVASDGKAERRPVEIGLSEGAQDEVVSGLHEGEMVIVDGQAGLPDGAAISVAGAEEGAGK
jgi:RND family efflux transporter MFP subunit